MDRNLIQQLQKNEEEEKKEDSIYELRTTVPITKNTAVVGINKQNVVKLWA
jgi:hypothetical protein